MNAPTLPVDAAASMARLLALLDVEALEDDLFRGQSQDMGWKRVYGGQVVGQALMAAARTVPAERPCHSCHAYFIRPGDPAAPIDYRVERDRDGFSFTTRRVVASQHGRPIFNLAGSFQTVEPGLDHAAPMPDAPAPETLLNEAQLGQRNAHRTPEPWRSLWAARDRPIEFRPVAPGDQFEPKVEPPFQRNWFRAAAPVSVDAALARALLGYASDMTLLDTCLMPHAVAWHDPKLQAASLDHSIWFHATPDLNDWLLFDQESPRASGGRGLNLGRVFGADGTLVATVMQEGLIRYRDA